MFIKKAKYKTTFAKKTNKLRALGIITWFISFPMAFALLPGPLLEIPIYKKISILIAFAFSIFGLYSLFSIVEENRKWHRLFEKFYEKFTKEKNNSQTYESFKKQRNCLKELKDFSYWLIVSKNLNYENELQRIENGIENLKLQGKITSYELIYEIAEKLLQNYENPKIYMKTEIFLQNESIFEEYLLKNFWKLWKNSKNIHKRTIIPTLILFFISILFIAGKIISWSIIMLFLLFLYIIWNIFKSNEIKNFRLDYLQKNLSQFYNAINSAKAYYFLSQKENSHFPELSLLFGDIATILSENILKRGKLLQKYENSWKYILSPIPLFKEKFPEIVVIFLNKQRSQIIKDSTDVQKFILLWRENEIKKLQKLHLSTEIPELNSQSKRREVLIKNLQKLQ